jgi:hypothetical protein
MQITLAPAENTAIQDKEAGADDCVFSSNTGVLRFKEVQQDVTDPPPPCQWQAHHAQKDKDQILRLKRNKACHLCS